MINFDYDNEFEFDDGDDILNISAQEKLSKAAMKLKEHKASLMKELHSIKGDEVPEKLLKDIIKTYDVDTRNPKNKPKEINDGLYHKDDLITSIYKDKASGNYFLYEKFGEVGGIDSMTSKVTKKVLLDFVKNK